MLISALWTPAGRCGGGSFGSLGTAAIKDRQYPNSRFDRTNSKSVGLKKNSGNSILNSHTTLAGGQRKVCGPRWTPFTIAKSASVPPNAIMLVEAKNVCFGRSCADHL